MQAENTLCFKKKCPDLHPFTPPPKYSRLNSNMENWPPTQNPLPTVDIILQREDAALVLIQRQNPPHGWALPGGFVDWGESCETAAKREALEELSVPVELLSQLGTYSAPDRDPRLHTISVVYVAEQTSADPVEAADDAKEARWFHEKDIPWKELCFDHDAILRDYFQWKKACTACGRRPLEN